jgi:hypothetical protein
VLSVAMALVISHVLFAMVRQISGRTTLAVGIAIIGIVAIAPMLYGRSMLFTVVFAALEVHLLVRATVLGERTALWFVPLVFVLWANVHIHFLYGLFVYGCFFAQSWLDAPRKRSDPAEAERAWSLATRVSAVGVVCLLATLANPYHVRIYDPIVRYLVQVPLIYRHLQELSPPSLTSIPSWMTLALALLVVLGAGRRLIERPFLLLLFAVAMMVALRSRATRGSWS